MSLEKPKMLDKPVYFASLTGLEGTFEAFPESYVVVDKLTNKTRRIAPVIVKFVGSIAKVEREDVYERMMDPKYYGIHWIKADDHAIIQDAKKKLEKMRKATLEYEGAKSKADLIAEGHFDKEKKGSPEIEGQDKKKKTEEKKK